MNWFKKSIKIGIIRGFFIVAKKRAIKKAKKTGLIWHVVFLGKDFYEVSEHFFENAKYKIEKSLYNTNDNKVEFAKIRALFFGKNDK